MKKGIGFDFKPYLIEWFLLIFGLVLMLGFIVYSLFLEKDRILETEEDRLVTQAKIINEDISSKLYLIHKAFLDIQDMVEKDGFENIDKLTEQLKLYLRFFPISRTFSILNKDGKIVASSRDEIVGFDAKDREYFQMAKDEKSKDKLVISNPYNTTTTAIWTINLSLKLEDLNGNFIGVVIATFDPEKLMQLLNSVFYSKDMRASIISGDGILFLTNPSYPKILGINLNKPDTLFTKHINSNKKINIFSGINHIPNENRLVAFHTISPLNLDLSKPLYVGVSRELNSLYLSFKNEVFIFMFLYLVLVVISIPSLYILQKRRYKLKMYELEVENAHKKRLESLAYIDGLTEVSNRRYFDQVFEQEWKYCLRNKKTLSLILIDIDFFKDYNDFYGHQEGDKCLIEVANTLKNSLSRSHDFLARYGGEEFVLILPDTQVEGAKKVSDDLRNSVKNLQIPHQKSKASKVVTISLGLSYTIPADNLSLEVLLRKADEALYKSKEAGRDRVSIEALED